jgi:MoaA/NifB/PqqE/SkfB family radical SAM enzyme
MSNDETMKTSYKDNILRSVSLNPENVKSIKPDILRLEVTNVCNDRCLFCGNRKMSRPVGFIKESIVKKALIQARAMGIQKVSFYTIGEPLLHPGLANFVKMAKDQKFDYAFLNTNGGVASEEKMRILVGSGIDSIAFSINAINKKDYEIIHGKNDFDNVVEKLKWLYYYRNSNKLTFNLYVSFIKTRITDYDEDKIRLFFSDMCDEVRIQNVQNIGGFFPEISEFGVACSDLYFHYELPCRLLFKSITVTCEGYLTACSVDYQNYLVYADLNTDDMSDAWRNQIIVELRERHLQKNVKGLICDNCVHCVQDTPQPLLMKFAVPFNMRDICSK